MTSFIKQQAWSKHIIVDSNTMLYWQILDEHTIVD